MKIRKLLFEGDILKLMSFTLITKPIALITQVLMASFFGAGIQMDAFAFSMFPINLFSGMVKRMFSAVAIPQIIKIRENLGQEEVHRYQNAMVLLFHFPVTILFILLAIRGDIFVDLVGVNLPAETKAYAYRFLRFLAIPAFFLSAVGFGSSLLNLNKHFKLPALMLPLNAVITLGGLYFLHGRMGIWALPVSFAISQSIQAPLILLKVWSTRSMVLAKPHLTRTQISGLWSLSWMILLTQSLLLINSFIDKWFATGLEVGSISSINYSMTLINFGVQIFSLSLVVVMFTKMSEFLATNDLVGCDRYIRSNLLRVTNYVVPLSLALFVVSPEVVRILFERGAFDAEDVRRTSDALAMYMLGLPALVINGVVTRIFQSLQCLKEKILLAFQYLATNVLGNVLLVKSLATTGLAISSSLAINLHLLLSLGVLYSFRNGLGVGQYVWIIARAYLMALLSWLSYHYLGFDSVVERWVSGAGPPLVDDQGGP